MAVSTWNKKKKFLLKGWEASQRILEPTVISVHTSIIAVYVSYWARIHESPRSYIRAYWWCLCIPTILSSIHKWNFGYMWPDCKNPACHENAQVTQCTFLVHHVKNHLSPVFVIFMSKNLSNLCHRLRRVNVSYEGEISILTYLVCTAAVHGARC